MCSSWKWTLFLAALIFISVSGSQHQPLSRVAIHRGTALLESSASVVAEPRIVGLKGESVETVEVSFTRPGRPSSSDWIGLFSPANFNSTACPDEDEAPKLCTAPIKFQYANFSSKDYVTIGKGSLKFRIINQRQDYAFGLFSGGLENPVLVAVSNSISFSNPNAPLFPRLALGHSSDEISVTWTSGYSIEEAIPFVSWRPHDEQGFLRTPAHTLTYTRNDMCGAPAKTVGWRDPGYTHTSYLKDLWPSTKYFYKAGHKLRNGSIVFGEENHFTSPPAPGQDSLQRVVIFGDMGKAERDLSNEYSNNQPGALITADRLKLELDEYDIAFGIGDLSYSDGYVSQWDQFLEQVDDIAKRVPFMVASGNHERDWPLSGSFFNSSDSGGECGVVAQTIYNMPAKNRAKFWYSADYGMFRFCVADTENDWREGTEQYKFLEECFSSVDRQKQPWLVFLAHRVMGYSSGWFYATQGTFAEPMARENLQKLWQKYKVDLAFYGHLHQYERTCPVYENVCISKERDNYSGAFNATIHIVTGNAGAILTDFTPLNTTWSLVRDKDFGFTRLTAYNHSSLLFEYKKSRTGDVYDKFVISRDYRDVMGCDVALRICPEVQLVR